MEAPNEVKPKKHRRSESFVYFFSLLFPSHSLISTKHHNLILTSSEHRGRKKKGTATVESINPGRAPLGFHQSLPGSSHLLQHDNQSVATHTSDCTETSSQIAYLPVCVKFQLSLCMLNNVYLLS